MNTNYAGGSDICSRNPNITYKTRVFKRKNITYYHKITSAHMLQCKLYSSIS